MDNNTEVSRQLPEEPVQTGGGQEPPAGRGRSFDQWLEQDPALRSEFDRRVTKGIATARER